MTELVLKSPKNKIYTLNLAQAKRMKPIGYGPNKTLVNTASTIELVEKDCIVRIEAYQNFMKVVLLDETVLLSTDTLHALTHKLGDTFNICHKSHVVNFIHVSRLHRDGNLEMGNGDIVPIARRRKTEFMNALEDWLGE